MKTEEQTGKRNFREMMWARHSNPKSGWSRLASWPLFVTAVYFRKRWLIVLTILFGILNPVLFSEPEDAEEDWMYRVVQAEERWLDDGNRLLGLGYPQILNSTGLLAMVYGLYSAYNRRPVSTAVSSITGLALGQICMKVIIDHYDRLDESVRT